MSLGRKAAVALAVLAVPFVGMALGAPAQQDSGTASPSYLPDVQAKGLPASRYKVVYKSADCKLKFGGAAAKISVPGVPNIPGLPGVGGVIDAVVPGVDAPDVLCPSALGKDGLGKATGGMFAGGVYTLSAVTSWTEGLLKFDVAKVLRPLVVSVSDRLDARLVGPLRLRYFALALAGLIVASLFLFGRMARGALELLRVAALVGVSGFVLANIGGAYDTAAGAGRDLTSAALSVSGDDPSEPITSVRDGLIAEQWEAQQFGDRLPPQCSDAAHKALAEEESVLKAVDAAGCHDQAKRAAESSWGRFFAAVVYLLLTLTLAWALARLIVGVLVAQVVIAAALAFAPIAASLAPARFGRSIFAEWASAVARAVMGMAFSGLLLSISVLAVQGILATTWHPFLQLVLATVAACGSGRWSQRWLQRFEHRTHRSVSRSVVGGLAVGAGAGAATAVASRGAVSRGHEMASTAARRVTSPARRVAAGSAHEAREKVLSPVTEPIRLRRKIRHQVQQRDERARVKAGVAAHEAKHPPRRPRAATKSTGPRTPARPKTLTKREQPPWSKP